MDEIYFIDDPKNPQEDDDKSIVYDGIIIGAYAQRTLLRWLKKYKPNMVKVIMREVP